MGAIIKFQKNIDYYGSERKELLSFFTSRVSSVLDVGCGNGNFGKKLKVKGIAERVVGIEINSEAAGCARKNLDKVLNIDIEIDNFDLDKELFDVIIFADVLEHLKDPWTALGKFISLLKENGFILISIPNIRYYRILLKLIFKGEFVYENDGILDIGHLRFFTFKMLRIYLKQMNFEIVKLKRNFSGYLSLFFNLIFFNIFSDFFSRQIIVLAKRKVFKKTD